MSWTRLRLPRDRRRPDLVLPDVSDTIAFWRDGGRGALVQAARLASADRHDPQRLLRALRTTQGIRVLSLPIGLAAPHIDDRRCVRRPAEAGDLLAVISGIVGDPPRFILGPLRHPDVAHAAAAHDPGHPAASWSSRQFGGERGGHDLLNRECRLCAGGRRLPDRFPPRRPGPSGSVSPSILPPGECSPLTWTGPQGETSNCRGGHGSTVNVSGDVPVALTVGCRNVAVSPIVYRSIATTS